MEAASDNLINVFAYILTLAWNDIINRPFEIAGYTVSFFQVFAYTVVGGILLDIVWEVFNG